MVYLYQHEKLDTRVPLVDTVHVGRRRDIRALSSWEMSHVHKDNISLPNNGSGSRRKLAKYKRTTSHCPIMVGARPGTVGPAALPDAAEPAALSGGSNSGEGYSGRTTRTRNVPLGWQ